MGQIATMRGILHAIYWRLHAAYLRNERTDADKFLAMLRDEMGLYPSSLLGEIGPLHMERFRKIEQRISQRQFGRLSGDGLGIEDLMLSPTKKDKSCAEKDLCNALLYNKEEFMMALDIDFWANVTDEVNLDPYGRCDFFAREGRRLHVIEVKVGEAPSAVVSQIDKYRLAAELDMCKGLYDEVFAYVLAEGFSTYVAGELSRLQVTMVEHRGKPETLRRVGCKNPIPSSLLDSLRSGVAASTAR